MIHLEKAKKVFKSTVYEFLLRGWVGSEVIWIKVCVSFQIRVRRPPPLAVLSRVLVQSPLPAAWGCHEQPRPHPTWSCSTTQGSRTWATASVLTRSSQEPGVPAHGRRWEAGGRCRQRFPRRVSLHQVTKSLQSPSPDGKQTPSRQALSSDWSHWSEM